MKKAVSLFACLFLEVKKKQSPKAKALEHLFTDLYESGQFNGNVLIAEKGEILFQKSYGYANHKTNQKLNDSTVFDLASISKEFTATALHLLYKQRKIDYEKSICSYIPELKFYNKIKVKHLIHHTSGLPDFIPFLSKYWNPITKVRNIDIIQLFQKHQPKLIFKPGSKFKYNNTGYAFLGLIIERISGKSYADFLAENIFQPLEMNQTQTYRHFYDPWKISNYAIGYIADDSEKLKAVDDLETENFRHYLDGIIGAGQIKSTTKDLLKWDRALYKDILFDKKDKELFFNPVKLNNKRILHYGFGWVVKKEKNYGKFVYHPGRWGGYVNYFERNLTHDKTIIILQNKDLSHTIIPKNKIRDILYNIKPLDLTNQQLKKYAGMYEGENKSIYIEYKNKNLYYVINSDKKYKLRALSDHQFMTSQYLFDIYFNFKTTSKGKLKVYFEYPELETKQIFFKI